MRRPRFSTVQLGQRPRAVYRAVYSRSFVLKLAKSLQAKHIRPSGGRAPRSNNKMLSYRRETALQGALQFSPKVEDWNCETIFYGHYRSIGNGPP